MKVDIQNLEIAVARELSLQLSFSKIQLIKNIIKKWKLFVRNRIHIRILSNKKYKSVMNECSHKIFQCSVFTLIILVVKV